MVPSSLGGFVGLRASASGEHAQVPRHPIAVGHERRSPADGREGAPAAFERLAGSRLIYLDYRGMGLDRERFKGHLDLLLLSVIDVTPAHGYAIISALRERSKGAIDLPEGTVYPALHRLEETGLLASAWAGVGGRRRRVYRLTGAGAAALSEHRRGWKQFAAAVDGVLGWST